MENDRSLHAMGLSFVRNSVVEGDIILQDNNSEDFELWRKVESGLNFEGKLVLWHGEWYEYVRSLSDLDT